MSLATKENGKKWIQASVAIVCMILGYSLINLLQTLGGTFELESKISQYNAIAQVISVLLSLGTFVYIMKNEKTSSFLNEVYGEAIKVVWPDKNETVRHTVVIMIGVTIVGFILGFFDFSATWALSLVSK